MAVMTPEEVLEFGKRVVLFPEQRSKSRKIYYVEGNKLLRCSVLWSEGKKLYVFHSPVDILDIYHLIERVYSRKKKGVLIARRYGNRKSNKRRLIPLHKTGKGMGIVNNKPNALVVYNQLNIVEKKIQRNSKIEFKKQSVK